VDLIGIEKDPKTVKGSKRGYLTGIQYLAHERQASEALGRPINMCPWASDGCVNGCLITAGHGRFAPVQQARINRTVLFMSDREAYWEKLIRELMGLERQAHKRDMIPVARLNGVSDVLWEKTPVIIGDDRANNIMELFPNIQFMDYTKAPYHKRPAESLPSNYDLTFSRSESNDIEVLENLINGRRVAVVFDSKPTDPIPEYYNAIIPRYHANTSFKNYGLDQVEVVSGDENDLRFLDPAGVVVHLYAKGKARKDTTGFVVKRGQ